MNKQVDELWSKANEIANSQEQSNQLVLSLNNNFDLINQIGNTINDFPLLVEMVKDFCKKEYDKTPLKSIVMSIFTIIYFVSPIDIIPDKIKGLGKIDDYLILSICLKFISDDLDDYKKWRENKSA